MTARSFVPGEYWPTSPRSGNEGDRVFRMRNFILQGERNEPYARVYRGSFNLNEDIPTANLTGTVTTTTASTEVIGAGTAFTTELHLGQFLLAFGGSGGHTIPLVVDEITDDTHFRACRLPHAATAGATATKLPVLDEMNKKRVTLERGSAVENDRGNIFAVGSGTVRLNGVVLPGTSLVAARTPKVALYNSTLATYSVATLGFATPASLTAAAVAGGTKNMQAGVYSVRAVEARQATQGYGNPSPKAEVTLATGDLIRVTLPATTADAWMFFVTLHTQGGGINGPWYRYELPAVYVRVGGGAGEIPAAGGTYDIEYNDAEVSGSDLLTFNNDAPPHAEFVALMTGMPVWISCMGPGATSPGPFIAPSKPRNIEAAPAAFFVATSPPDTIIGYVIGPQGRLYLMGVNSMQIALPTQSQDSRIPPFAVRPFWKSGFPNPYTLLAVGDGLVGMTTNGLARSIAAGDEGSEEYGFAVAMEELLANISPGHCLLRLDPKNNAVALFHSGHNLNASGFWTTRVWLYGLRDNKWIGDILLTSTTGDMLVSGAAAVNGQLEFLAGGRQLGGTTAVRTYRWDDDRAAQEVPAYIAWQFSDWGAERQTKAVKMLGVKGKVSGLASAGIWGAEPGETIPVASVENDPNSVSKSGTIPLTASVSVIDADEIGLDVDNLKQFTVRIDTTWPGVGELDRIDEVVVDAILRGARR
jgi:hypothetical protein